MLIIYLFSREQHLDDRLSPILATHLLYIQLPSGPRSSIPLAESTVEHMVLTPKYMDIVQDSELCYQGNWAEIGHKKGPLPPILPAEPKLLFPELIDLEQISPGIRSFF